MRRQWLLQGTPLCGARPGVGDLFTPWQGGIPLPNTSQCLSPAHGLLQEEALCHPEQRLRGEVGGCTLTLGSSRAWAARGSEHRAQRRPG